MESGINGRAIDFAKFGRLFLNNGNWDGTQLVPADWVAESTEIDQTVDWDSYYGDSPFFQEEGGFYKYMWWGQQRAGAASDFMALGNHGQFIYISPAKKLIIVRHGESYGEFGGGAGWRRLFYQFATDF